MSIYDQIAKGFNPGSGLVDAARIDLQGKKLAHEQELDRQNQALQTKDRQNDRDQQLFENKIKLQKLLNSVDETKRERMKAQIADYVKVAEWVESQPDTQTAYQQALQKLKLQYPGANFSDTYDPQQTAILRAIVQPTDKLFESESYGRPIEAQDSEGNPAFIQANKSGDIKEVEGYSPPSEALGFNSKPLTNTQVAKNVTIDMARRALKSRKLNQDQIKAATQQYTDTGRSNSNYDPTLSNILKWALSRKIGEDSEFEELYTEYYGKAAEAEQPQAEASSEQPPVQGARKAPDGNWYVEDPDRPGKYLQVVQ